MDNEIQGSLASVSQDDEAARELEKEHI